MWLIIQPYFFLKGFSFERYIPKSRQYICLTNHTTNWDFFLGGIVLREHMYFVASDHIYRNKISGGIIKFLADPIARKKGGSGDEAVKEILSRIERGANICMMAEGNRSFNGETGFISPRTARLVKESGVGLVNVAIHGGYFINPRWGTKKRRGKYSAQAVNEYGAEELAKMSEEEIYAAICSDLRVDAYVDQEKLMAEYSCKNPAECLETALFVCSECGSFSSLSSRGDILSCSCCGSRMRFNKFGYLENAEEGGKEIRFSRICDWSRWQTERLRELLKEPRSGTEPIFRDSGLRLYIMNLKNSKSLLAKGELCLFEDRLELSGEEGNKLVFPVEDINKISLALRGKLLFTIHGNYYEISSKKEYCALKYLIAVRFLMGKDYKD